MLLYSSKDSISILLHSPTFDPHLLVLRCANLSLFNHLETINWDAILLEIINSFPLPNGQYVLRDTAKGTSGKDKSTYLQVPKRDDQQLLNAVTLGSGSGTAVLEDESGMMRNLIFIFSRMLKLNTMLLCALWSKYCMLLQNAFSFFTIEGME